VGRSDVGGGVVAAVHDSVYKVSAKAYNGESRKLLTGHAKCEDQTVPVSYTDGGGGGRAWVENVPEGFIELFYPR